MGAALFLETRVSVCLPVKESWGRCQSYNRWLDLLQGLFVNPDDRRATASSFAIRVWGRVTWFALGMLVESPGLPEEGRW